ncbi:hypothetical protein GCM10028777_31500 [Angustibacter speluncae]
MDATTGRPQQVLHQERLWPSPGWWVVVALGAAMAGAAVLPVGVLVVAPVALVVLAACAAGLVAASARVVVADGELRAGPARVPVGLLGEAVALRGEQARHARGPGLDARAFLVLRGWVDPVVRVELVDPQDPTPYWLVSTRRPDDLVRALEAART